MTNFNPVTRRALDRSTGEALVCTLFRQSAAGNVWRCVPETPRGGRRMELKMEKDLAFEWQHPDAVEEREDD